MRESNRDSGPSWLTDNEARSALDQIERSQHMVIDEIDMPRWYWWGLAAGWIGLGIVTDLGGAWLVMLASLLFGAVHAAVSHWVLGGRHRSPQLSVRADVAGRRTPAFVGLALFGLVAVTIVGSFVAAADGAAHPVTAASIGVAIVIVLGGPHLMGLIRRRAARSLRSA